MSAIVTTGLVKAGFELVDNLFTSDEEKAEGRRKVLELEQQGELAKLQARSGIVQAEAKSEHALTAMWRPIVMLAFAAVVLFDQVFAPVLIALGAPEAIQPDVPEDVWQLLKIGIGGYVVGRSAEKGIDKWKGKRE